MTARPRACRPGDFDYYALEGFADLSRKDQTRFRAWGHDLWWIPLSDG